MGEGGPQVASLAPRKRVEVAGGCGSEKQQEPGSGEVSDSCAKGEAGVAENLWRGCSEFDPCELQPPSNVEVEPPLFS